MCRPWKYNPKKPQHWYESAEKGRLSHKESEKVSEQTDQDPNQPSIDMSLGSGPMSFDLGRSGSSLALPDGGVEKEDF